MRLSCKKINIFMGRCLRSLAFFHKSKEDDGTFKEFAFGVKVKFKVLKGDLV